MNLKCINGALIKSKIELNLKACLKGGMSFRWTQPDLDCKKYIGVIENRIYELFQNETNNQIEYKCYSKDTFTEADIVNHLTDYFRLDHNLDESYKYWSKRDANFEHRIKTYPDILNGIRVLRLNPVENLFSFICSSNNNIKRISQMVSNMCNYFGNLIGNLNGVDYYEFPTIERLSQKDVEAKLRELKFGYRAKFIYKAAVFIKENHKDETWLYSLRNQPYEEVHHSLTRIPGIGKKVADCISLMSLDKLEAIPVDTHVLSLAKNQYKFFESSNKDNKKNNSLTDKSYKEIADKFRLLWGEQAGWAQTVMFIDDLRGFKTEPILSKSVSYTSIGKIKQEEVDDKSLLKPLLAVKRPSSELTESPQVKPKQKSKFKKSL